MASISISSNSSTSPEPKENYTFAFGLVTSLFFMFGFITCLNDILVPHLKALFTLNYAQAALIEFCFFAAFFLISLPAGKLVAKLGYKVGTIAGLALTALACLLFYPAASLQSYPFFLFGLFVLASGITIIQVAVNPYISILGPRKTASSRLNLAQAFNSLGTTLAPLFGAAFILAVKVQSAADLKLMPESDLAAYRATQAASVQGPYLVLFAALVLLAIVVRYSHLPVITEAIDETLHSADAKMKQASAWKYRHLTLGAIGIFCYVGAEVAIGSYLVNFLGLPGVMSMPEVMAGKYVAYYWGGAMIGRFIGSAVMRKIKPGNALTMNAFFALSLVIAAMTTHGQLAMIAILAVGLFNSIMFPTIFTLAIDGLGEHTAQGSGILCMAIVGGAVIPLLQGVMADHLGLQHSLLLPIVCYLFIAFYGIRGYQQSR